MSQQASKQVRGARHSDIAQVVEIHMSTFPGFFLTLLGARFLAAFYRGLIDSPLGILLVVEVDREAVGFVGGVTDEAAFFTWLKSSKRREFLREAALAAVRHPTAIRRLLRARQRDADAAHSTHAAVLLSIGVRPEVKGQGVGGSLVEAFANSLDELGVAEYCLTTDARDNESTNSFYRSQGFRLVRSFVTPEGRSMNEYATKTAPSSRGR